MSVAKLATVLTVIFVVSVVVLAGELLYVLRRRRPFRSQSSPPPISGEDQHPKKDLLYFFCLKAQTQVEPAGVPRENPDGSSPDDEVIDVFKLLEANGPSRVLCTIKEDDREDVDSVVDSVEIPVPEKGSVTVVLSPCESPMFFTPVGSPARDGTESESVVLVAGEG